MRTGKSNWTCCPFHPVIKLSGVRQLERGAAGRGSTRIEGYNVLHYWQREFQQTQINGFLRLGLEVRNLP